MKNSTQEEPRGETPGARAPRQTGASFKIHQKMLSLGSHYWIENEPGETVYKVDSKLGWHKYFSFEDANGNQLAKILKSYSVKKQWKSKDRWREVGCGEKISLLKTLRGRVNKRLDQVHGNLIDHEYTIGRGDQSGQCLKNYPSRGQLQRGDQAPTG
jgi:uncharacterized protein YxjI